MKTTDRGDEMTEDVEARLAEIDQPCPTCEGTQRHPPGDARGFACWDCVDGRRALEAEETAWLFGLVRELQAALLEIATWDSEKARTHNHMGVREFAAAILEEAESRRTLCAKT